MNANGTRFHLLLGRSDWARCTDADGGPVLSGSTPSPPAAARLAWRDQALGLRPTLFDFPEAPDEPRLRLGQRRGAARDAFGSWYWIAESQTEIRAFSAAGEASSRFWSSADPDPCEAREPGAFQAKDPGTEPQPLRLAGLTVTDDHYLVVGSADLPGVLVFDLYGGGPPRRLLWPEALQPLDMAARPGGGAFVLDEVPGGSRLWLLDRQLRLEGVPPDALPSPGLEPFQPKEGVSRQVPLRLRPRPLDLAPEIVAVEALSCDEALLLARDQRFYRLVPGHELQPVAAHERPVAFDSRMAHDFCWLPPVGPCPADDDLGQVYLATDDGNQAVRFELKRDGDGLRLDFDYCFFPLRRFSGKGLVRGGERAYYDLGERWLAIVAQPRPRFHPSGVLLTPLTATVNGRRHRLFDGAEPGCVWHRLVLDADIPNGTAVRVWSRASDDPDLLERSAWREEPRPYRRGTGSELPYVRSVAGFDSWELLFQQARGRYLQLRLELAGDGRSSPRLRALRAYYPRFSYLQYLPAIYRQEPGSASFLDRFLANVEGSYTRLEDRIATVQTLFDAAGAPKEGLDWLASWFGVALDPAWSEAKRRLFIEHAMVFFQYRGTLRGLYQALRLALEPEVDPDLFQQLLPTDRQRSVRLIERFRTRRIPAVALGDPSDGAEERAGPDRIADAWKPGQQPSLNQLYRRNYTHNAGAWNLATPAPSAFPLTRPADSAHAAFWQAFCHDLLGFVPSSTAADAGRWRAFLRRRYGRVAELEASHGHGYGSFDTVRLPTSLPADGPLVLDWYEFEALVLPVARNAHRFSVLLPVPTGQQAGSRSAQASLELVRRLVELEKPAHTIFDLKLYWAMFRVGEVRLGYDTLLDEGSRGTPLRLGQGYLAESHLAPPVADMPGRIRPGQDAL